MFWFWIIRLVLLLLLVHGAVLGRMVLCIILRLIFISLMKIWILRLKGLMAFALFSNRFLYFISIMQGFGGMK